MPKKILADNRVMVCLAIAIFLIGLLVSLATCNFEWLSRFGALMICIGVIIMARPTISGQEILFEVEDEKTGLSLNDPMYYEAMGEPVPPEVLDSNKSRAALGWIGPIVVFLGTAINGFGDLLNLVVGW